MEVLKLVDLINFISIFKQWSRIKDQDKQIFDTEIAKFKYENGRVYWE